MMIKFASFVEINNLKKQNIMEAKIFLKKAAFMAAVMLFYANVTVIGAAAPEILIRSIPPLGQNGNAQGKVVWDGLTPENADNYAVIAMLHALWDGGGGYYVKPYADNYLNPIDPDGYFSILITTGGIDADVNEVLFYLVERASITDADVARPSTMTGKYLATKTIYRDHPDLPLPEVIPSIRPGMVQADTEITLSSFEEGAIFYTLDGSNPTASLTAQPYNDEVFSVPANGALLVKAAVKNGETFSPVFSFLWLPKEQLTTPFWGISVSLALNGEPFGMELSKDLTRERMKPVVMLTKWIRTFNTTRNGNNHINSIAKEMGLRTMIGLDITNDLSKNDEEIEGLRKILQAGPVDLICVGNETSLSNVNVATLISCIDRVREMLIAQGMTVPIGTADIANISWRFSLLEIVDFLGINVYCGTWDNVPEAQMLDAVKQTYSNTLTAYESKHVILTETGTPYSGGVYSVSGGTQTPSTKKAANYLSGFCEWVKQEQTASFYFEAYDENVKSQNGGHPIEQYFGIMNGDLKLHPFYGFLAPISSVSLNKTTATLTVGATVQLEEAIEPSIAANQNVTWSSSNTAVAEVSQTGLITAKAAGEATITVTTDDGDFTAQCIVTVSDATIEVTGAEIAKTPLFSVYPNPTSGLVTLEFETARAYIVTLAEMSGSISLRETINGQTAQIDVSNYPAGMYLLTIDDGKQQNAIRIVKR